MHITSRDLRVKVDPLKEPDMKKLARVLIAIAEKMARQNITGKPMQKHSQHHAKGPCFEGAEAV